MKILAEINTSTHTVLEVAVLDRILQEISEIKQKMKAPAEKISVNLKEAAKMLGCSYDYVKQLFHDGKLKGRQEGKGAVILIDYQSIVDFIKAGQSTAGSGMILPTPPVEEIQAASDQQMIEMQQRLQKKRRT